MVGTFAASQFAHLCHDILVAHVDHVIRTKPFADFKSVVPRARQDDGVCSQHLGDGGPRETDRTRPCYNDAFTRDKSATLGQTVHCGTGRDDKRRLFVGHGIGHADQRVDIVHGIFRKTTIRWETVGPVALSTSP